MVASSIITLGIGPASTIGFFITSGLGNYAIEDTTLPECRIYYISAESRLYAIEAENRVYAIPMEDRIYVIDSEGRIYMIPTENRTYEITCEV